MLKHPKNVLSPYFETNQHLMADLVIAKSAAFTSRTFPCTKFDSEPGSTDQFFKSVLMREINPWPPSRCCKLLRYCGSQLWRSFAAVKMIPYNKTNLWEKVRICVDESKCQPNNTYITRLVVDIAICEHRIEILHGFFSWTVVVGLQAFLDCSQIHWSLDDFMIILMSRNNEVEGE